MKSSLWGHFWAILAQNLANQDFSINIALLVLRKELKKEKML